MNTNLITQVTPKPKIRTNKNKKTSADTNKSALNSGIKDSFKQMEDDQHNDEATENSEEEKVSEKQFRKVTYLCPVSACVFVCQTMEENTAEQHLQSCHSGSYVLGQKFLKL